LVTLANAHLGQTDAVTTADSFESASDDNVEPDDVRSDMSMNGLPLSTVTNSDDFLSMQRENWVTSVAALHNTDLVVSGKKEKLFYFFVLHIFVSFICCQHTGID